MLHNLLQFLLCLHCTEVKRLDHGSGRSEFWSVVWWRRKLLDDLASHTSRWLFSAHNGAVSKVAFHKEDHLFVPYENVIAAHNVQPSLHRRLEAHFVFIGAGACRGGRWWYGGYNRFWACGDEMLTELHKLRVHPSDVAELGGSKLWEIGLHNLLESSNVSKNPS
jgi:hypothetical protein